MFLCLCLCVGYEQFKWNENQLLLKETQKKEFVRKKIDLN